MKEYLKMRNYFSGKVNVDNDGNLSDDKYHRGSLGDFDEKYFEAISHAINSHDELVYMNKGLLAALEAVIKWYDMEADHSIEPDFYKRVAACKASEDMGRAAIAKAKGGAA